jgi:small redox-active disulfide protein 2
MEIKVLGSCCGNNDQLGALVKEVLSEKGLAGNVQVVTDVKEVLAYGVLKTPGLVVNGKVVAHGRFPSRDELRSLLGA